ADARSPASLAPWALPISPAGSSAPPRKRRGSRAVAPPLILVPGLGFGGAEFFVLAPRLRRFGYRVVVFRHLAWRGSLADKARALGALVANVDGGAPHLVAHSMGGNIVLEMIRLRPDLATGRIVLLGTPLH